MSSKAETYYTYDVLDGLERISRNSASAIEKDGRDCGVLSMKGLCGDIEYFLVSLHRDEEYSYRHKLYVSIIDKLDSSGNDDPIASSVIYFTDTLSLTTYIQSNLSNVVWG